jgi:hypothetical protein
MGTGGEEKRALEAQKAEEPPLRRPPVKLRKFFISPPGGRSQLQNFLVRHSEVDGGISKGAARIVEVSLGECDQ